MNDGCFFNHTCTCQGTGAQLPSGLTYTFNGHIFKGFAAEGPTHSPYPIPPLVAALQVQLGHLK